MTKERFIHNLHLARTAHVRMLNSVKLLVSGLTIEEDQFALDVTETSFGKWFYGEAMLFGNGNSRMQLDDMEDIIVKFYDSLTKIYKIYFGTKSGGLTGFFGMKKKASDAEKELAKRLYDEMIVMSDQLKQKLRIFESQLSSMPEEKFEEIAYSVPVKPEPVKEEEKDEGTRYQFGARGH